MGMNFFTLWGMHIGKRYAAGVWCWDCKKRVTSIGDIYICPKCGRQERQLSFNSAFRELGFDETSPKKHTGIDGASGFTWYTGGKTIDAVKRKLRRSIFVKDEYGKIYPIRKFWDIFKDVIEEKTESREFS